MKSSTTLARKKTSERPASGFQLVVMANDVFARYPLPVRGAIVLGRGDGVDVTVDDPLVSRRHVQIHLGDTIEVEDLAGVNGTFVNGRRLAARERVELTAGEVIGIGEAVAVLQPRHGRVNASPTMEDLSGERTSALSQIPAHIVIADDAMKRLYALAALAARSPLNVLLLGETGVGKELLAETIHACSRRAQGPFLSLNCATFSDSLLESELFGHEKGAFTGALKSTPGLLESASGGTVFLDEVGEMAPAIQARLLRALGTREVRAVGGAKTKIVDVRFVSATNRDIASEIQKGGFRRDLYFRLNGLTLRVPPLRERRGEIKLLAARFVADASRKMEQEREPVLGEGVLARLEQHDWPGNVRELRNVVERAVMLSRGGPIDAKHVLFDEGTAEYPAPEAAAAESIKASGSANVKAEVATIERQRIVDALDEFGGNQTRVARHLGISRGTLITRLDAYGLSRPRKPRA